MNIRVKKGTIAFVFVALFMLGTSSVFAASLPLKTDVSKQQRRVEAYKQIRNANPQGRLAFGDIERLYDGILKDMVEARDEEFGTSLNQYIKAAFNGAKNGQDPQVAAQIIDKTLKKAFYLTVKHELIEAIEEIEKTEEAHHKLDEAIVYYEVLASTVKEEDKQLNQHIISGLKIARQAIKNKNLSKLKIAAQIVDKNIINAFYDVILHEIKEVEEYASTNPAEAKIEKLEGLLYYQAIKGKVKTGNKIGNAVIEGMLKGPIDAVDYDVIAEELNRGFVAKVLHELEEVEEDWGEQEAIVKAWEGLLYYNIFQNDVKDKLGVKKAEELLVNLRQLTKATKSEDKGIAKELIEQIEDDIQSYFVQL
ncbi:hypothetical protein Halha_0802 [Halobacteroides halobius DSM 5150]|uniref:Uncharacterized protein n=1 Tax=Halobacteroides halobius (strain ATCC 35273 / DSM 5150 / MD-1) TaxID=748449 RepID=L0K9J4_HALHC|nr:hypothetical protein [Halobacteroides halobius]AGB40773.1 hypothetical protein Halha_0802 [Halobacteroides halobius DSM 5150]